MNLYNFYAKKKTIKIEKLQLFTKWNVFCDNLYISEKMFFWKSY